MMELTVSIEDTDNGEEMRRTFEKLNWEQLWQALILYDRDKYHREKRKFYIISSRRRNQATN